MNGCQRRNRLRTATIGFLLVGLCTSATTGDLCAAEGAAKDQPHSETFFRRLFVPADSPETWPVGSERFLPIPRTEFLQWIRQNQRGATRKQRPISISNATYRAELLTDDVLRGTVELTVALPAEQPRLLPLVPLNLAVESAFWRRDPTQKALLGLWKRNDSSSPKSAIWVEKSDTLVMQWQLAARNIDSERIDFFLQKPIVVPQTFELSLPANHSAALSHAQLLQTDSGPQGESRWVFQLAPRETHRLRIHRPRLAQMTPSPPLVSQSTSYQLEPVGLSITTQLRLDARESQTTELRASLDGELRVVAVSIDQQPVAWRVVGEVGTSTLVIPRPESLQPQSVEISCLAKFASDPSTPWALPKLRFNDVAWTEGTTSLLVSPDLELRSLIPREATLLHIVGIANQAAKHVSEGEVYRLQEWSRDAGIEIEVGRPRPSLSARTLTTIELGRDESQANIVAELSSSRGEVYRVQAAIAAGWSIESVTATPQSALNEWHIDRATDSAKLYVQLNRPISEQKPLRVEIKARETTGASVLPAPVGHLKLLRFSATPVQEELLQLRTRKSEHSVLADRLQRARLALKELPPEFRDFPLESPVGTLLNVSVLNDAEVIEFRRQPAQYEANLQIEVKAFPDSFEQTYQINCHWKSGAVSELIFEMDTPLPETILWTLAGQKGLVTMERLDVTNKKPSSTARYLLRLPVAMSDDFRLQASYSQPAQPLERCNLLRLLDGAHSLGWSGQVFLRGPLKGTKILDQGWTPTAHSTNKSVQAQLPILGTYQLSPEALRRGNASGGLRLQRQTTASPAPLLVAWLAEYDTLQAADGAALHTVRYSLENLGTSEAEMTLPAGAELQEAWLDDQPLELKQLASEGKVYQFRFDHELHWPSLVLKYSTHTLPLGGTASIQPVVPACSFPVNMGRWTLWAPSQYEFDYAKQNGSLQRNPWWKRVFGPLARSRGETVFNPFRGASWTGLWSAPLEGQQTKRLAEELAIQLVGRMDVGPSEPLGVVLNDLAAEHQVENLFCVDRRALLANGIQANTLSNQWIAKNRVVRSQKARILSLSGYRLALLVGPGTILLTTAERVAHWHDQLRPTEAPGVFMVSSDELAERIAKIRRSRSNNVLVVSKWQNSPREASSLWKNSGSPMLADEGRRAQTVEFVEELPTLVVRRAYVQHALWYVLLLLAVVLGVWQLTHYPKVMIFFGALAGSACLAVPVQWLTIPQAIFLGLVAAAIVRVALKIPQFVEQHSEQLHKVAQTTATFWLVCLTLHNTVLVQNSFAAEVTSATSNSATQQSLSRVPRVLIPIDSQGLQQGEDVYLSEWFLEKLQQSLRPVLNDGAESVLLSASYRGSLPRPPEDNASSDPSKLTEPWTLLWKVESFRPNCQLSLPLKREEATWNENAHRLDGVPVKLDWHTAGNGCTVTLPEPGLHWLQVVALPRFETNEQAAGLRLHVPPVADATLHLTRAPNVEDLQVVGAGQATLNDEHERWQFLLGAKETIDLRWTPIAASNNKTSWESLEQLSWLRVDPAAARLDVQLSVSGFQSESQLLEMDVSAQLKLVLPEENSLIAEVIVPSPSQPTRLQLKLRPGLPADFVIPLRFELQRTVSIGRIFFPRVRVLGKPPTQNLLAVSVSSGLSYDEQASNDLRSLEPAEFSKYWSTSTEEPLYAYKLEQEDPDWSLRVWPDPQSFRVQQTLRVYCSPKAAQVDFEAVVDDMTGSWLSHRIQVPESLHVDSISVRDISGDSAKANSVPVRWSRVRPTEGMLFLGRPLRHAHQIQLQGHITASESEIELPQIRLFQGERGEIHLDLYRTEDALVSWTDPKLAPRGMPGLRIPRDRESIYVGHYSWRSSQAGELSKIRLARNDQAFQATSVTTLKLGLAGWAARLNSRILVKQGVVSRLSLKVPDSLRTPYVLQPEQVGVIDEVVETSDGTEITVLLAQPAAAGDEMVVHLGGNLSLPVDQRLVVPNLAWSGAAQRERYVLLPTFVEGKPIRWQTSGLRRQALPPQLRSYAPEEQTAHSFRLEQSQFEAKERIFQGTMRNAKVRYAKVSGIIDAEGLLTATAELVLQPSRATSCAIQLPPESQLRQLIVGDRPARRELLNSDRWKLPVGPPFMPQKIVVSYSTELGSTGTNMRLIPPQIFLGDQELPKPETWWRLHAAHGLQLGEAARGQSTSELQFVKSSSRFPRLVWEDALSQALELPREEGRAWAETWQTLIRQAKRDWQVANLFASDTEGLAIGEETHQGFLAAFAEQDTSPAPRQSLLTYPPSLPVNAALAPVRQEHFFVSDSKGLLVVAVSRGAPLDLWRWFAAIALVCGTLAVVLQLRHHPHWHHHLCHWPHSLALGGGFVWWLLLKPSVIGMLVIALTLMAWAIKQWRSFRHRRRQKPSTQLAVSAS